MKTIKGIKFKDKHEFQKKVYYPKQFNNSLMKLTSHIINLEYPVFEADGRLRVETNNQVIVETANVLKSIGNKFSQLSLSQEYDEHTPYENFVRKIYGKHKIRHNSFVNWRCFTHLMEVLTEEDHQMLHGKRVKNIKFKEFQFIIQKITYKLFCDDWKPALMMNSYFSSMNAKKYGYEGYTKRKFSRRKLAHMLKVLENHDYIRVSYDSKSRRIIEIGTNNPYFQVEGCPEPGFSLKDDGTNLHRKLKALEAKNKTLKAALEETTASLKETSAELKKVLIDNDGIIEIAQQTNKQTSETNERIDEVIEDFEIKQKEQVKDIKLKDEKIEHLKYQVEQLKAGNDITVQEPQNSRNAEQDDETKRLIDSIVCGSAVGDAEIA